MILIAGISPRIKTLESTPRLCPSCGLAQAYLKRIDHYVNLFFIPLFPVKKGKPVLICNRCQAQGIGDKKAEASRRVKEVLMCKQCGRTLEGNFRFCPHCGQRQ